MYLASSSTHVDHEAWLIDLVHPFTSIPIESGSASMRNMMVVMSSWGMIERLRTFPGVLDILVLSRNLISVSKLDDAGVKIMFEKDTCKMVRGSLVLMQGVRIGTLYKLQGSIVIDGYNNSVVPESGVENLVVSREKTMLWHQRLAHIGENGLQIFHGKGMVEGMSNSSLDFDFYENCVYGK